MCMLMHHCAELRTTKLSANIIYIIALMKICSSHIFKHLKNLSRQGINDNN